LTSSGDPTHLKLDLEFWKQELKGSQALEGKNLGLFTLGFGLGFHV